MMHFNARDTIDPIPASDVPLWVSDGVVGTKCSVFLTTLVVYDAGKLNIYIVVHVNLTPILQP